MNSTSATARPASARGDRRGRLPSIRLLVTIIVIVPAALVAVSLMTIATLTTRSIAEQLGQTIVNTATERVSQDVRQYLGSAMRLSDAYVRRIDDGALSTADLRSWEQQMFRDLAATPDVASICFSTSNGDATWLLYAHDRLELGLVDGNNRDQAVEYPATPDGRVDRSKPIRVYHYNAPGRPWYQLAISHDKPVWTPAYHWFGEQGGASETGIGYTRVVRDRQTKLPLGVLVIDVTLSDLSERLQQLPIATNGYAFIVDDLGKLIAASDGLVNSPEGSRLSPAESNSPAAQAVAAMLEEVMVPSHQSGNESSEPLTRRVMLRGEPARAQVTDLRPYPGIHWHVVTVLPESAFLSSASTLRWRAGIFAVGTLIGGLALALLLSRWLSEPLVRLAAHVARVGAGDFDRRLHLTHAAELRKLSDEVNTMAAGLKRRLLLENALAVAETVQQRLLPSAAPLVNGLDIAGSTQYCDATGGDYYDYIEYAPSPGSPMRSLLAVGDVVGHGVGAALVMATARGALRAGCTGSESLADLMRAMNQVLCKSVSDGMFMTMSLVVVQPETGIVRWCTAGHDPTIVYHPDTDTFEELEDHAGPPLGVDPMAEYVESTRVCAHPGSLLLIGTDGIWEARNAAGEMFGKHRLREILRAAGRDGSAAAVSTVIRTRLLDWLDGLPLRDDVTFVAVRVRHTSTPTPDHASLSSSGIHLARH